MKGLLGNCLPAEILLLTIAVLSGCSAPSPKDFGGRWRQVNRFSTTTVPISLQRSYEYFASPLDGTLKDMLSRWAKDTKMRLDYRFPDDFTLYTPVSAIRTPNVETAVSELNGIYAKQGISVAVHDGALVVTGTLRGSTQNVNLNSRNPIAGALLPHVISPGPAPVGQTSHPKGAPDPAGT